MERSKNSIVTRNTVGIASVILFHAVGLAGFMTPQFTPLFLKLVPFHLLLMLMLAISGQPVRNTRFGFFVIIAYLSGFLIELAGVKTGLIFGEYQYGETLGFKLAEIPLMIGANWILMIMAAGSVMTIIGIKHPLAGIFGGALLLVILDVLIEPVAIRYHYWNWEDGTVPFQNYIGWFFFSAGLLAVYWKLVDKKRNIIAVSLYVAQLIFFALLNG